MARILVIDDEPMLLRVVRRALGTLHALTCTHDPEEAHRLIAAGARFDVIVCDLMMPAMTGMELHAALVRVDPDQADRMIFLTGGACSDEAQAFLARFPNARIEKPFEAVALQALVIQRLARATASGDR